MAARVEAARQDVEGKDAKNREGTRDPVAELDHGLDRWVRREDPIGARRPRRSTAVTRSRRTDDRSAEDHEHIEHEHRPRKQSVAALGFGQGGIPQPAGYRSVAQQPKRSLANHLPVVPV